MAYDKKLLEQMSMAKNAHLMHTDRTCNTLNPPAPKICIVYVATNSNHFGHDSKLKTLGSLDKS